MSVRRFWFWIGWTLLQASLEALCLWGWAHGDHGWLNLLAIILGVPAVFVDVRQVAKAWSERDGLHA